MKGENELQPRETSPLAAGDVEQVRNVLGQMLERVPLSDLIHVIGEALQPLLPVGDGFFFVTGVHSPEGRHYSTESNLRFDDIRETLADFLHATEHRDGEEFMSPNEVRG